jgi:hypothetical protein
MALSPVCNRPAYTASVIAACRPPGWGRPSLYGRIASFSVQRLARGRALVRMPDPPPRRAALLCAGSVESLSH